MNTPVNCEECKFKVFDMDGFYCNHPESFKETFFGRGLNYMRSDVGSCGPDGLLFQRRTEKRQA